MPVVKFNKSQSPRVNDEATEATVYDHARVADLVTTKASRTQSKRTRDLKTRTKVLFQLLRQDEDEAKIQLQANRHKEQPIKTPKGYLKCLHEEEEADVESSQLRYAEMTNLSRTTVQRRALTRAWPLHAEGAADEEEVALL